MWDEDIIIPLGFFFTVIVTSIGIPLVRALGRKWERQSTARPPDLTRLDDRLTRIEQAIDAMSVEVERISEGQRFTTRLFAERMQEPPAIAAGGPGNGAAPPAPASEITTGSEERR